MIRVGIVLGVLMLQWTVPGSGGTVTAEGAPVPSLVISQFKVTTSDGQFFTLYNPSATSTVNLSGFELEYFNNSDPTKASSSKFVSLAGTLDPGRSYMLSDGSATICYQMMVETASLGFSATSGSVELLQLPAQSSSSVPVPPAIQDYVGWTKKASGNNDLWSLSPSGGSVKVAGGQSISWLRTLPVQAPSAGAWQPVHPKSDDPCQLQIVQSDGTDSAQTVASTDSQLGVGQEPPATIISLASAESDDTPVLPAADKGLAAPQITELLPNPAGTGTDDTDEFIELYNPNAVPFDLAGFTLQTGLTTKHDYTFASGTTLPAKSFKAFYSADTGLTLSNTSGQAALLDPFGKALSQAAQYGSAKDGQTWALANGKWYWTTSPTPNAANVVRQPVSTASKSTASSKTSSSQSGVQGASTAAAGSSDAQDTVAQQVPIHPLVLAVVGVIAVGYGVYEYRHDIANKIYQFRRNRKPGRAARI
jgi:hypothetical protein